MRIDAPIFTGSFSLNGSTLGSLTSVATTGSNTFLGGQSATSFAGDQLTANDRAYLRRIDGIAGTTIEVIAPISASAGITGSTNFDTIVNKPTLVSGSSQVIDILSSLNSATASFTPRISNLESKSSSVDISISNINSVTASNITRLSNLETKSSSVDISITNINSYTSSQDTKNTTLGSYTGSNDTKWTSIGNLTGSYATTGSNTFYGTQVFSGSVFIATDLIVQGSSSIQYISASSVSIGTNIVNLNTATPSVRYAGISVQDSGSSAGVTGSMLWDSTCNRWIYSNPSGVGYSGGIIMSGPRAATFGQETTLTCNYVAKSGGGDHLYDSCIIDDGTTVCINANLKGSGTITGTTIYGSTAVCSAVGKFTSCIDAGSGTFSSSITAAGGTTITSANAQTTLNLNNTNACATIASAIYFNKNGTPKWGIGTDVYSNTGANEIQIYDFTNDLIRAKFTTSGANIIGTLGVTCAATFSSCVTATQFNVSTSGGSTQIYNTGGGHTVITNATANKDMNIQTSGTGGQYFNTAGADRLIISSTGAATFACNVSVSGVLQVKSTSSTPSIWSGQYGGAISILGDNSTSNRYIDLSIVDSTGALATQGLRLTNSGNVGIGITSPASKFHVAGHGNVAGGNIMIGCVSDSVGKWSYLVSTQYNSSTQPQGFALIGGYSTATENAVVIGGSIYEVNPATSIQFNTHTANSHNLGGTGRMTIACTGITTFACQVCSKRFIGSSTIGFGSLITGTQSTACQSIESLWALASNRSTAVKGSQYGNGTWYIQGYTSAGNWIYYKFMIHDPVWFRAYVYLANYADTSLRKGCLQYSLDNSATWVDLANATNWQYSGTLDGSIALSGDSKYITLRWDSGGGASSLVGWNSVEFTACGSAFYSVNGLG